MSFGRSIVNWNDASSVCAKTRDAIADAVIARQPLGADAERHLATCADCRAYHAESDALWARLAELPTPAPAPDARGRFDAALRRESGAARGWSRQIALLAAVLVFGVVLGYGATRIRGGAAPTRVAAASDSAPQFLLLLYDNGGGSSTPISPDRMNAIIAEYSAWAGRLAAAGQLVSAEKLSDDPAQWLGGSVATSDGATVGGFFLIRAHDLAEARRIAEGCPHLKYGGRIELRPIQPT
jgi:hypothetical protein